MTSAPVRKALSSAFVVGCAGSVLAALVPPLAFVLLRREPRTPLDQPRLLTHVPTPVGEPGGSMANAIAGTLIVTGLASLMAVPVGIASGIYMSEYAGTRFASIVRVAADTLNGVPSILIGVFAYGVAVLPFKQFSALAGGFALGVMMIPIIARTAEELLLLVPASLREGALALGATRAHAVFTVVLPAALPGIITGVTLAPARIAGETVPLLFTSFNNRFFTTKLTQPISTLTVQVFTYATGPCEDWHRQAWAGRAGARDDRVGVLPARACGDAPPRADARGRMTEGARRADVDVHRSHAAAHLLVGVLDTRSRRTMSCAPRPGCPSTRVPVRRATWRAARSVRRAR
jgi:phosphate transport system permease protein